MTSSRGGYGGLSSLILHSLLDPKKTKLHNISYFFFFFTHSKFIASTASNNEDKTELKLIFNQRLHDHQRNVLQSNHYKTLGNSVIVLCKKYPNLHHASSLMSAHGRTANKKLT